MTKTPDRLREILEYHGVVNIDTHRLELDVFEIDHAIKSIEELFDEKLEEVLDYTTALYVDSIKTLIRRRWQESKEGK